MTTAQTTTETTEAFADRMFEVLNHGSLAIMLSIGHRTGLFDTLAAGGGTSEEIAKRAGLNERYVREWLGALTVGRIVNYDPATKTYTLPEAYAPVLSGGASADNLAPFMQYVGLMGTVEDKVIDCFRNGGGVPYEAFETFVDVMSQESSQTVLPVLIDDVLPLVDGLPGRLEQGIDVLDLGCGMGKAVTLMARTYPNSRFRGYDFLPAAIAAAREHSAPFGLNNLEFGQVDAAKLDEPERYDLITTFDAIHDQADPAAVLRNIRKALKPGGVYIMQDVRASSNLEENLDHPAGVLLYTVSTMHCMTVSLSQGGAGLGTVWGEQLALQMLAEAGFGNVEVHTLPHDVQNNWYVCRA